MPGATSAMTSAQAVQEQLQVAAASTRAELGGVDPAEVLGNIGPYLRITEEVAPDVIAELRGMAEGSGVPFETLFVLNAGAELMQSLGRLECTVVGITGAGTGDGHVLLAHNEDATAGWADLTYVIKAEPDDAPAFVAFTYAGLLLHQGVNAAGLGSVGNALYARDARPGIPKLLLYRRAITQGTIEGAIRTVTDDRRAYGNNHLFATADGDLYDVEVSGSRWAMRSRRQSLSGARQPLHPARHDRSRPGRGPAQLTVAPDPRRNPHRARVGTAGRLRAEAADGRSRQLSAVGLQASRAGERPRLRHDRQRRHRRHRSRALGLQREPLSRRRQCCFSLLRYC